MELPFDVLCQIVGYFVQPNLSLVNRAFRDAVMEMHTKPMFRHVEKYCDGMGLFMTSTRARWYMVNKMFFPKPNHWVPYIGIEQGTESQCTARTVRNARCKRPWSHRDTKLCGAHHRHVILKLF